MLFFSFVSLSMGFSAANSSGHFSNHAEVAPNHAGITFAVSNTLVTHTPPPPSLIPSSHHCHQRPLYCFHSLSSQSWIYYNHVFPFAGNHTRNSLRPSDGRTCNSVAWSLVPRLRHCCGREFRRWNHLLKSECCESSFVDGKILFVLQKKIHNIR